MLLFSWTNTHQYIPAEPAGNNSFCRMQWPTLCRCPDGWWRSHFQTFQMSHNGGDPCSLCRNTSKQLSHEWNSGKIKYMCVCTYVCLSLAHFWAVHHSTVTPWVITLFRWISITLKNLPLKQENLLLLLFVLCQTCQLTHEEVKDGHVHDVQQSSPAVIRWSLFDFLAVVRVHLPPEEFQNITQTASCSHFVFHFLQESVHLLCKNVTKM